MKRVLLVSVLSALVCGGAVASDYVYTETETVSTWESVSVQPVDNGRYVSSRDVKPVRRPCAKKAAAPVRVKTHTEVIDHYQVYQPVTVYQPMGTQIQRRVVPATNCNKCGM